MAKKTKAKKKRRDWRSETLDAMVRLREELWLAGAALSRANSISEALTGRLSPKTAKGRK
jgi:hypothetical protein